MGKVVILFFIVLTEPCLALADNANQSRNQLLLDLETRNLDFTKEPAKPAKPNNGRNLLFQNWAQRRGLRMNRIVKGRPINAPRFPIAPQRIGDRIERARMMQEKLSAKFRSNK